MVEGSKPNHLYFCIYFHARREPQTLRHAANRTTTTPMREKDIAVIEVNTNSQSNRHRMTQLC